MSCRQAGHSSEQEQLLGRSVLQDGCELPQLLHLGKQTFLGTAS